jgi:hypothetical protein
MDTTEELNGTYFYAGRTNLTAGGLFFMIYCESIADHFGIDDVAGIAALAVLIIRRPERNPREQGRNVPSLESHEALFQTS